MQPVLADLDRVGHAGRKPGHLEQPPLKPQARDAPVLTEALDLVVQHMDDSSYKAGSHPLGRDSPVGKKAGNAYVATGPGPDSFSG